MKIDVIIPTYKPDQKFLKLVYELNRQTVKPDRILVMNTEEKYYNSLIYGTRFKEDNPNVKVVHLGRREFNHGKTRNEGAKRVDGQILVFMTQDAIPADEHMIEELLRPLTNKSVAVSYARQIAAEDCRPVEAFTRNFNYPDTDRVQSLETLQEMGIKTYFCSNACAAYKTYVFKDLGGFPGFTIFNEDMIFAAKVIQSGKKIYYASGAKVIHSHNHGGKKLFRRNFDLGVSQADHPDIFGAVSSEGEGVRLVKETAEYLKRQKKAYMIPELIYKSGCKYIGYKLGINYKKLPSKVILWCTDNKPYWDRYWDKMNVPEDVHAGYGKNAEGL
ncbi:glycosyltransferase family 2 protein [bacterium C-53]|nr:glycosyltransferase family 2 protein [Lachnospiraceae bacterium]NBI01493.1 glycosyltransferase family 2 protein [Lachnospiraceae bacterium]RKJ12800.1 glycosyltransferase family 2 protein [bacterium C-53]